MDIINIKKTLNSMADEGYSFRQNEKVALAGMLGQKNKKGARALLLEGPPGAGKTYLPEVLAEVLGAELVVDQFHAWTDSDQLFSGVDVAAAVAGEADNVREDGVLARTAKLSHSATPDHPVVLLLDEVDKAPERAEYLLLDWLQSGRVPIAPGVHEQTELENVLVFLTSNAVRQLGDALLRRVRRVRLQPLPAATVEEIVYSSTAAPKGVCKVARKAAQEIADIEGTFVSPQEIVNFVNELMLVAESVNDCALSLAGWAAKTPKGEHAALQSNKTAVLWGEVKKAK